MRKPKGLLPWTCFLVAAALSGCGVTRATVPLRPDLQYPERFVCEASGTRPAIPPEYAIDWSKVTTVDQAHAEHDKFVGVLRTREGLVAGYVLDLEGKHFLCVNNAAWVRDFYSKLPKDTAVPAAPRR